MKLTEPSPKRKVRILPRAKPLPPDTNIRRHPLSAHFADMSTREVKALEYDIERNGVRNPITMLRGLFAKRPAPHYPPGMLGRLDPGDPATSRAVALLLRHPQLLKRYPEERWGTKR